MKNKTVTKYIYGSIFFFSLLATQIFAAPENKQISENRIIEILEETHIPELKFEDVPFTNALNYINKFCSEKNRDGKAIKITCSAGVLTNNPPEISLELYDMSGNVREWCWDFMNTNYYLECFNQGIVENPTGSQTGPDHIVRGGSSYASRSYCLVACRSQKHPSQALNSIGFRILRIFQ